MSEVRVLLANTPPMLESLISAILAHEPDIVVAGSVEEKAQLGAAIDTTRADVVIIGEQKPEAAHDYDATLLSHPHVKLLLITTAGQHGYLYALRPMLTPIPDLSVATLLAAIRNGYDLLDAQR